MWLLWLLRLFVFKQKTAYEMRISAWSSDVCSSDLVRNVVRYTLENRKITDVEDDASLLIRSEEGSTLRSGISNEITYDTRDSRFDPREGFITSLRTEF